MTKFRLIVFAAVFLFAAGCGGTTNSDTSSDMSFNDNASEQFIEANAESDLENDKPVTAEELAAQASEVCAGRAFAGCIVGIMRGGASEEYVNKVTAEFEKHMSLLGYTVTTGGEDPAGDITILYAEGDEEDAIAFLTREDIVLIICCDMESTEQLLYSDNEYRYIGEAIAAVGMNEEECQKIEHR